VTVLATDRRTGLQEHCLGHRDQAWARPELAEGSPVFPARVLLDRQAPALSDRSVGSCLGLDLVASCCKSYMTLMELVSGMSCDSGEPQIPGSGSVTGYPSAYDEAVTRSDCPARAVAYILSQSTGGDGNPESAGIRRAFVGQVVDG
jgi:hypothetical protein